MAELNKEFLKKLGIDKDDDQTRWMLDAAPQLFLWLQNNITDENILTPTEVKEYEELKKSNKLLSEQDLERKLQEIQGENPGLSQCKESDLKIAQTKLQRKRKLSKKQKRAMEELSAVENSQGVKISKLNMQLEDMESETRTILEKTKEVAEELETIEGENRKLYKELQDTVYAPNFFTHQMPFYEYNNNIVEMIKHLECYCNENQIFTVVPVLDTNENTTLGDLQLAKDGLVHARYQETLLESKINAQETVTTKINSGAIQIPVDMTQLMSMMEEYDRVNDEKENQLADLKKNLLQRLSDLVLSQIDLLSTKNVKIKHERAVNRNQNIKQLQPIVTQIIQISEIVWFALNLDYERLNKDFSCQDFGANYATHVRIEVMRRLLNGEAVPKYLVTAQEEIIKTIADTLGMSEKTMDVKEVFEAYSDFQENLTEAVTYLMKGEAADSLIKFMEELNVVENSLKKFVYGGTTSKPQLRDPRFAKTISELHGRNFDIKEKYSDMKFLMQRRDNFLEKDKFGRYYNVLWIWFLTEPKKVLQAIMEVKKANQERPAHLSGIRRQH